MKRKDLVSALLSADPSPAPDTADEKQARVAAGAVRAMGLELHRLTEKADEAHMLREQIETGSIVVELDPEALEPSFIADRLAPIDDPQYRQLVASIRKDGQALPILVRPHPDRTGIYQIAYGHRRWHAARELAVKVRAIIQTLTDTELVIAQGKENAERRNLSFIERALFAANLDAGGFDRATINAALAVHTTELSRLLTVAATVPAAIVTLIGPAPKAGRTRWLELAEYLQTKGAQQLAVEILDTPSLKRQGTDAQIRSTDGNAPQCYFGAEGGRGDRKRTWRTSRTSNPLRAWSAGLGRRALREGIRHILAPLLARPGAPLRHADPPDRR